MAVASSKIKQTDIHSKGIFPKSIDVGKIPLLRISPGIVALIKNSLSGVHFCKVSADKKIGIKKQPKVWAHRRKEDAQ